MSVCLAHMDLVQDGMETTNNSTAVKADPLHQRLSQKSDT